MEVGRTLPSSAQMSLFLALFDSYESGDITTGETIMSIPPSNPRAAKPEGAIHWLGILAGAAASFFGTPQLYGQTIEMIHGYTATHYGGEFIEASTYVWFALVAGGIFFLVRGLTAGGLRIASLLVARRFF